MTDVRPQECPNCAATGLGTYCPNCGQKVPTPDDLAARHFVSEIAEAITNVEGRFWLTLRTLLVHPGELTRDYLLGKRQRYLKPIQLFVTSNVWFFLAQSFTHYNTFTTPIRVHLTMTPYGDQIRPLVVGVLRRSGLEQEEFGRRINGIMEDQAKTLVFVMVPMFAFLTWLLIGPRRPFGQYLVFSANFFSMLLIVLPFTSVLESMVGHPRFADLLMSVGLPVYLALALRKAFSLKPLAAWPAGVALMVATGTVVLIYRFLLLLCGLLFVGTAG